VIIRMAIFVDNILYYFVLNLQAQLCDIMYIILYILIFVIILYCFYSLKFTFILKLNISNEG